MSEIKTYGDARQRLPKDLKKRIVEISEEIETNGFSASTVALMLELGAAVALLETGYFDMPNLNQNRFTRG